MKSFAWSLVSSLALSAVASPVPDSMLMYLNKRAPAVTAEQVTQLDFYAEYAASSYCNSEAPVGAAIKCSSDACPLVEKNGATVAATFSAKITDLQGYLAVDPVSKVIVATFRGSHSIRNWITNFVFLQEPCDIVDGCLVHAGFAKGYREISDALVASLTKAREANPDYAIVFTGHSLGAAVATVAAGFLREKGFAIDIYSYGSPRVGNRAMVDHITKQAGNEYRVTHLSDPVPRLPPIFTNYRHTSPEFWLSDGATEKVDFQAADIKVCEGYASLKCNAGTLGLDINAHGFYFTAISSCSPEGTPFKRAEDTRVSIAAAGGGKSDLAAADMSDADLEAHLNDYVRQDRDAVEAMGGDIWG